MKSVWLLLICLTGIIFFSSCNKCRIDEDECRDDIICTEVFVTVSVPLVFNNLSIRDISYSTSVLKDSGKELLRHEYNKPFDMGPFFAPIVNDGHLSSVEKSGSVVILAIYDISGKKIYEDEYTVGHDCCHVMKISGPDKIIL